MTTDKEFIEELTKVAIKDPGKAADILAVGMTAGVDGTCVIDLDLVRKNYEMRRLPD